MAKSMKEKSEVRAKLFLNGRSQAVRLPKEFRFPGKEVRIRHTPEGVLLEPVGPEERLWRTVDEWFAQIDNLRGNHLFPEREEPPLAEERDPIL